MSAAAALVRHECDAGSGSSVEEKARERRGQFWWVWGVKRVPGFAEKRTFGPVDGRMQTALDGRTRQNRAVRTDAWGLGSAMEMP